MRPALLMVALLAAAPALGQAPTPAPRIESRDGRHALIVDGAPFTILGGPVNNSSNYPEALETGWPVLEREWARIAWERPTWGAAKPDDGAALSTRMGAWTITASWGEWQFGFKEWTWLRSAPPPWAAEPVGGVAVAQLSADTFLVVGDHVRLQFAAADGAPGATLVRVEEGRFVDGQWTTTRVWNGDQTDYGINLVDRPQVLKVTVGRYR